MAFLLRLPSLGRIAGPSKAVMGQLWDAQRRQAHCEARKVCAAAALGAGGAGAEAAALRLGRELVLLTSLRAGASQDEGAYGADLIRDDWCVAKKKK